MSKKEALPEVETDKVNVEIDGPDDGLLKESLEGEFVYISAVIATV